MSTFLPDKASMQPQHKPPIPLPTITTSNLFIKYLLYSSRKTNSLYTNVLDANGNMWYGNFVLVVTAIAFLRICYSHGVGDGFLKLYSQSNDKKNIISSYLIYILMVIFGISFLLWLVNSFIPQQATSSLFGLLQSQLKYIILIVMCDTLNFRLIDIISNSTSIYLFSKN